MKITFKESSCEFDGLTVVLSIMLLYATLNDNFLFKFSYMDSMWTVICITLFIALLLRIACLIIQLKKAFKGKESNKSNQYWCFLLKAGRKFGICLARLSVRTSAFQAEKNGSTPLPSAISPKYKGTKACCHLGKSRLPVKSWKCRNIQSVGWRCGTEQGILSVHLHW